MPPNSLGRSPDCGRVVAYADCGRGSGTLWQARLYTNEAPRPEGRGFKMMEPGRIGGLPTPIDRGRVEAATPLRIGVLVSGRGSNLRALLEAFPVGHPLVHIGLVVTNRSGCGAIEYAREAAIPVEIVSGSDYASRDAQQAAMAARLAAAESDLVVLAGYDQVLGPSLLEPYAGRMINIHPSLLPAFGGTLHAQAAALRHGVKVTGCTVHFVTPEIDGGPIIAQEVVPIRDEDTVESLSLRILAQEHVILPRVVALIAAGKVRVEGRRVRVD